MFYATEAHPVALRRAHLLMALALALPALLLTNEVFREWYGIDTDNEAGTNDKTLYYFLPFESADQYDRQDMDVIEAF